MATEYVIDCSALVDVMVGTDVPARELLQRVRDVRLHAPLVADAEVGQVLRRQVRVGVVDEPTARGFLHGLRHMITERYPHDPILAAAWALRDNVSFYDALYVALAARLGLPLLTTDRKLSETPVTLPCVVEYVGG